MWTGCFQILSWRGRRRGNLRVYRCLAKEIKGLEETVLARVKGNAGFENLLGVSGIGKALGLTVLLESGDMGRFVSAGHFTSYCRCVGSQRLSNGKKEGQGQHEEREQMAGVGLHRGGQLRDPLQRHRQALLQRKKARDERDGGDQGRGHKLAAGHLPCPERRGPVPGGAGFSHRATQRAGAASLDWVG